MYDRARLRQAFANEPGYGHLTVFPLDRTFISFVSSPATVALYAPPTYLGPDAGRRVRLALSDADYALTAACWAPAFQDWRLGQTTSLLVGIAGLAGWCVQRGRARAAGVLYALLAAVKIFPALFLLYFAWKRQWRLVAWGAVGCAVLAGFTLWFVGPVSCVAFLREIVPEISRGTSNWQNQNLAGLWFHLRYGVGGTFAGTVPAGVDQMLLRGLMLATWGAGAWCARGALPRERFLWSAEHALVWASALLFLPIVWDHYFALSLIPGLGVCGVMAPRSRGVAGAIALLGLGITPVWTTAPGVHVRPLALALFWLVAAYVSRRATPAPESKNLSQI